MSAPGWRVAVALASTVSIGGLGGFGAPATAGYPNECYHGVSGVQQRGMVAVERSAEPAFFAALRRIGARAAARIEPVGARAVDFGSPAARDAGLAAVRNVPGVRWAEPELEVRMHLKATDPMVPRLWGLAKIGAPRAWDVETGVGDDVTVAVLDTGVDLNHPDLKAKTTSGDDVVNGDEIAQDDHGHGTHVAGTIGASANNKIGVAGVSWGAKILAVKVLNENGSGSSCDVLVGILDAVERKANVINMSLGVNAPCPFAFRAALELAVQQDVLPVASSGNDGLVGAPDNAPANCPGVLGVGATTSQDKAANFSTFGPWVDVAAPGAEILSTAFLPGKGSTYDLGSGTSMAAPHVAGLAALLKAAHPEWTPKQIADRIMATADDLGPRGRDDFYGAGRINAARALGR